MRRFFFDPDSRSGDRVILSREESQHITRVLRLPVGTRVELLDGLGNVFSAHLTADGKRMQAEICGILISAEAEKKSLQLWQAMLQGDKMDSLVQKCTELGVSTMQPFHSSRCQGKLDQRLAAKKHLRWQRISLAACKQCLREKPMAVGEPLTFGTIVADLKTSADREHPRQLKLLFWEEENGVHLGDIEGIAGAESIVLLLGPEGGITEEEVALARSQGFTTVSLGKRILRAETATISAVSIVQFLRGWL